MNPESVRRTSHVLDSTFYKGVRVRGRHSGRYGKVSGDIYASESRVEVVWDAMGYATYEDRSNLVVLPKEAQRVDASESDKAVLRRMHAEQSKAVTKAASAASLANVKLQKEKDKLAAISLLLSN